MMWRIAGFEEMLVSPATRDQNEMGGLQKRDRFWCVSYLWTCCYSFSRFNIPQLMLESDSRMKTSRQGNRQMADKVRRKKTRSKTRSERDQTPPRQDTQPATAILDKYQVLALSRSGQPGSSYNKAIIRLIRGRPSKIGKRDHSWWKSAKTWETRLKRGGGTP